MGTVVAQVQLGQRDLYHGGIHPKVLANFNVNDNFFFTVYKFEREQGFVSVEDYYLVDMREKGNPRPISDIIISVYNNRCSNKDKIQKLSNECKEKTNYGFKKGVFNSMHIEDHTFQKYIRKARKQVEGSISEDTVALVTLTPDSNERINEIIIQDLEALDIDGHVLENGYNLGNGLHKNPFNKN
ncbi:MAG: hypothetical protein ABEK59_07625 [Halobacteria archaeon]